ncbi:unnamed protein product [Didymodactylos carnosus]|uniref:Uncharacterized protein n=1 Tax=Didymodactylos carnosus TaxID=1234261 RepID=A0A816ATF4_9BILA|nr:unnamed protein product [Didymodactylos carnosus]CAF4476626.1 unnamed protein product [Didymodactylos carnosus]
MLSEVFTIDTRDPTVPLQAAQLIQRSGADPVIWTSTELARTTSAGNFRLYKDGSGIFGLWVPNSQAFYSDGAPPNICAPDAQSGYTIDRSHRFKAEPVWKDRSYSRSSEYRRDDKVLADSSRNRREIRVAPYDRSVGYGIVTDYNRQQHHFSSRQQHHHYHCQRDESASQSRLTADKHHSAPYERARPASSKAATPVRHSTLTHQRQQRKTLLNRKRRERKKRVVTINMMVMEQEQNVHQQSASSLPEEDGNDSDEGPPNHVAELIRTDESSDMEDLADDLERLGGNEQPQHRDKSNN